MKIIVLRFIKSNKKDYLIIFKFLDTCAQLKSNKCDVQIILIYSSR